MKTYKLVFKSGEIISIELYAGDGLVDHFRNLRQHVQTFGKPSRFRLFETPVPHILWKEYEVYPDDDDRSIINIAVLAANMKAALETGLNLFSFWRRKQK